MERNDWLRLPEEDLLKQCREERHRASGPGGQRRNKVSTAVRLTHLPSGVRVKADESRYLQANRSHAVKRLRERLALDLRRPFDLDAAAIPEEFVRARRGGGGLSVSIANPAYPVVAATALDALEAANGSYARAASALGVTTSQLLRLFERDREVLRAVERIRSRQKPELQA